MTELEPTDAPIQNTPGYIEKVLTYQARISGFAKEPTAKGVKIADALSKIATDTKLSSNEQSEQLTLVIDELINPTNGK